MNAWIKTLLPALDQPGAGGKTFTYILIPVVFQSLAIYSIYRAIKWSRDKRQSTTQSVLSTPAPDSVGSEPARKDPNKDREPGAWIPRAFVYPEITPCHQPIKGIKPPSYRPFRWGEYQTTTVYCATKPVTMGIRTMPWSEWMELDESFSFYQRIRAFRVNQCGKMVLHVLPAREDEAIKVAGGAEAVKELLYELAEYLHRRYPSLFRISRLPESASAPTIGGVPLSWQEKMPIKTIEVMETGRKYNLEGLEEMDDVKMGEEAFRIVNSLMQDDIAIMIEGSDGKYYLQAGLICVPGSWRLRDKIGMPLDMIHITGEVPQFKEKLQLGMNRFFQRLSLDKPVIRNNYSIQAIQQRASDTKLDKETLSDLDPEELSWCESVNGPEDDFVHRQSHETDNVLCISPSALRVRSERQTLRRLPRTGAVVFGIRTYQYKVEELVQEKGVAARLASAVRSWPEDIALYKGRRRYHDVLLKYLDEYAERDGITGPVEGMLPFPY